MVYGLCVDSKCPTLKVLADTLEGYGADLADAFLEIATGTACKSDTLSEADADALFRTLVLDDDIPVGEARAAYTEASDLL